MPVAEPPENLAERILRQAERRMLSGDTCPPAIPVDRASAPSASARHTLGDWRVTFGVVAALAASVLILLWLPSLAPRDVALAPTYQSASPPAGLDNARADVKLAERVWAEPAAAEPAAESAQFESKHDESAAEDDSRSMAQRAKELAPAAAAAPPGNAPVYGASVPGSALSDQPPMPGMGGMGGMGGAGGIPGGGEPGRTMGLGSSVGGGAYGAAGQPMPGAARPAAPPGPGMGLDPRGGLESARDMAEGARDMGYPGAAPPATKVRWVG